MYLLSNKIYLALNVSLFIAYNGTKERPISSAAIAKHYGLKKRSLESILQILGNKNILQSVRCKSGGYYINKAEKINISDIIQCFIEGIMPDDHSSNEFNKIIKDSINTEYENWLKKLSDISIRDLCDRSKKARIKNINETIIDFTI